MTRLYILVALLLCGNAFAFSRFLQRAALLPSSNQQRIQRSRVGGVSAAGQRSKKTTIILHRTASSRTTTATTSLQSSLAVPATRTVVKSAAALLIATAGVILQRKRLGNLLYPGTAPDPSHHEPLPPGPIRGCPFLGNVVWMTNMNDFLYRVSAKLGSPKVWKFFGVGNPIAVLSGSSTINKMLGKEFKDGGVSQLVQFGNLVELFGNESLSFEIQSRSRYQFMRQLVGQALTADAVAKGVPALQDAATKSIDRMLSSRISNTEVVMEDVCKYLTLEVAWRQIIGLDLKGEAEIETFHEAVKVWMSSFSNFYLTFLPKWILRKTKSYKAMKYLTEKIEDRIDSLLENGPDGSTMSAMVFAKSEENQANKLTRQQVIDNALLLIVAGAETSSLTLTNALFFLGSHPEAWKKVVEEQEVLVAKKGAALTKDQIDHDCPYLDAVVKETMRLTPVSGGGIRTTDDTIIVDGYQIPPNWWAMYSIPLTHMNDPTTWKADGSHMDFEVGFQPERWLNEATRPTTEFIPFGAGNRFCVGWVLAATEMRSFLAILAREMNAFDLVTDSKKCKWKEGIIRIPKDGVRIVPQVSM